MPLAARSAGHGGKLATQAEEESVPQTWAGADKGEGSSTLQQRLHLKHPEICNATQNPLAFMYLACMTGIAWCHQATPHQAVDRSAKQLHHLCSSSSAQQGSVITLRGEFHQQ